MKYTLGLSIHRITEMDLPPPSRKRSRVAANLVGLPVELIWPVVDDLPLHRVLELAFSSPSPGALLRPIEDSPAWSELLRGRMPAFERAWTSLNRLAWLWCSEPWMRSMNALSRSGLLEMSARRLRATSGPNISPSLDTLFWRAFQDFLGSSDAPIFKGPGEPLIMALCLFLPKDLLLALVGRDKLPQDPGHLSRQSDDYREYLVNPIDEVKLRDVYCHSLVSRKWTVDEAHQFVPYLARARRLLGQAYSAELRSMATVYGRFPAVLKTPMGPETPRPNTRHIRAGLLHDAASLPTSPMARPRSMSTWATGRGKFGRRFCYIVTALVPYNWCLRLFLVVVEQHPPSSDAARYPHDLLPDVRVALDGMKGVHQHGERKISVRRPRYAVLSGMPPLARFDTSSRSVGALPKPTAELEWLESFASTVHWMTSEFPHLVALVQDAQTSPQGGPSREWNGPIAAEGADYRLAIAQDPARDIAARLRADLIACESPDPSHSPSLLALYMPPWSTRARAIARYLVPSHQRLHVEVQELVYRDLVARVRRGLQTVADAERGGPSGSGNPGAPSERAGGTAAHDKLTSGELEAAAKTLRVFRRDPSFHVDKESLEKILGAIHLAESSLEMPQDADGDTATPSRPGPQQRLCYICRMQATPPHRIFAAMCVPCGNFNLAGNELSQPHKLDLSGKTALVTGGRVNLGYHTARRLLRCGANVIVSTRYPHDALQRFRREIGSGEWMHRLRIVGADFRAARDAFALVEQVRALVSDFGGKLDILINNAAQTLTDSVEQEEGAISRETKLQLAHSPTPTLSVHAYEARVRGEARVAIEGPSTKGLAAAELTSSVPRPKNPSTAVGLPQPLGSSWVQSLSEIPYEDVISAHSVNTFVPLILVRELSPLMSRKVRDRRQVEGYIVNVSSREGIFERRVGHAAKNGKHVHTNMSKAGLNMITETEAARLWHDGRVAMNTVDPGFMSAAPELEDSHGGERPLGWEDGAGRVLWPVAVGESGEEPVRGRFLKHYGASRVEPGLGR